MQININTILLIGIYSTYKLGMCSKSYKYHQSKTQDQAKTGELNIRDKKHESGNVYI